MNPLVSVVTPVFNGADYLADCIESVLKQTYDNFEYIIINNRSTDRTLEIANSYAQKDNRIRVHSNSDFVGVIANHNIAFGLISTEAKYCKVVSADDFIFPDCLTQLVEAAELNSSAGFVGCYQLSGSRVLWQGFPYPKNNIPGRDVCRQILLGNAPPFGFGTPTSLLYRADMIRTSSAFYPNASPHADTSACFKHLKDWNFAFVYQVLCYERTHEMTQSTKSKQMNRYSSAYLDDVLQHGEYYLAPEEQKRVLRRELNWYYEFLAINAHRFRDTEFWNYHKARLKELGYPVRLWKLVVAGARRVLRETMNPGLAVAKLRRRISV